MKILRTWIKIHATSFMKNLVNIIKQESTKVPWKLSSQKNTTPHFKEYCTKIDHISLAIIRFFFSQTNLVFTDILYSFCHSLFTFLPFDFWYSTDCWYYAKFIQCPYVFFIKTSKVFSLGMFLVCPIFHEIFLPVNGENNSWRW